MPIDGHDEVLRWSWIDGAVERTEGTFDEFLGEWVTQERRACP